MKLYTTLEFKEKDDKCYIAEIIDLDPVYNYKRSFIYRKDLNPNRDKVIIDKYVYEYDIVKSGIYECFKVDGINANFDKKCVCYIDVKKDDGKVIQYKNIKGILESINENKEIDLDNIDFY